VARTGEIGTIKILNAERVQDGVERLTFAAGAAAIEHVQSTEDDLLAAAETFDVSPTRCPRLPSGSSRSGRTARRPSRT